MKAEQFEQAITHMGDDSAIIQRLRARFGNGGNARRGNHDQQGAANMRPQQQSQPPREQQAQPPRERAVQRPTGLWCAICANNPSWANSAATHNLTSCRHLPTGNQTNQRPQGGGNPDLRRDRQPQSQRPMQSATDLRNDRGQRGNGPANTHPPCTHCGRTFACNWGRPAQLCYYYDARNSHEGVMRIKPRSDANYQLAHVRQKAYCYFAQLSGEFPPAMNFTTFNNMTPQLQQQYAA